MKISVIITVFNVEKYISRCLLSVLGQSIKDIEVIVVDDGSTDGTIVKIADNNPCVSIITQTNKGVSAARNVGLRIASGEYVVFVDGDDYLSEDYLETLIMSVENYDWVLSGMINFYNDGSENICSFDNDSMILDNEHAFWRFLNTPLLTSVCTKLYRNDIIKKNRLEFNEEMWKAEDRDFNLRYLRHIHDVRLLKYSGYYYRRYTPNSLSKRVDNNSFINDMLYWQMLKEICEEKRFHGIITRKRLSNILYNFVNDEIAFAANKSVSRHDFLMAIKNKRMLVDYGFLLKSFFLINAPVWQKFLILGQLHSLLYYVYKTY